MSLLPPAIQKAMAINPEMGSTYLDAEHIVILMQENRSFDHCFGTLQGVRGYNDPRAIRLPNQLPVWLQTDAAGDTYAPFRLDIKNTKAAWTGSLSHERETQVDANNHGKYDQWLNAKRSGNKNYADMPLTLGHYTREDLPFNYAMADAFTVCDQHFCSALTSTTPNRSFFWTGKLTHDKDGIHKANIRNDDYSYCDMPWKTFPELLEENDIHWKFYQNDLSCGGGYQSEEKAWLANFGCNMLEFFKAYNVKFSERYITSQQKQVKKLAEQINKLQKQKPVDEAAIQKKQEVLDKALSELVKWNKENYEKLSDSEKSLYRKAFVTNSGDPDFQSLAELSYNDNGDGRQLSVPKGDLLHQFREDVSNAKLPTVSWLAGPKNFSDHPKAPWYGAWYISEVLDILTRNPEVWKKTIFILTYDENDGYFDHIPPFSIPDNKVPGTGKCSVGIETEVEIVRLENELQQGVPPKKAREGAIGLGYRVPMIIASPWSRGGKVCSEVFDHTSTLQFLECFVNRKFGKNIKLDNISEWRRTICGDLSSAFSPYDGTQLEKIPFINRDKNVETIYNAKFKKDPSSFKKLSADEINQIGARPSIMGLQEKGIRPACALPYELYTNGGLSSDKKSFEIKFAAGNAVFKNAAGSPFTVYAPVKYNDEVSKDEISRNWYFAVIAGDHLTYKWPVNSFEGNRYHLRIHGPNGFYREFIGNGNDPQVSINCDYEKSGLNTSKLTGNVLINIINNDTNERTVTICDNSYKTGDITKIVASGSQVSIVLNLSESHNWYDFSVKLNKHEFFEHRFAGRVENGKITKTDPLMGGNL